jgi:hypothetical protein
MDPGWSVALHSRGDKISKGNHGWDPTSANRAAHEMHGSFFAEGPAFKQGLVVAPFDNVDVYALLLRLLALPEAPPEVNLHSSVWRTLKDAAPLAAQPAHQPTSQPAQEEIK